MDGLSAPLGENAATAVWPLCIASFMTFVGAKIASNTLVYAYYIYIEWKKTTYWYQYIYAPYQVDFMADGKLCKPFCFVVVIVFVCVPNIT